MQYSHEILAAKMDSIASTKVICDIEHETYYKIRVNRDLLPDVAMKELDMNTFKNWVDEKGLMFSEVNMHLAETLHFESLDQFLYYCRIIDDQGSYDLNTYAKYPFRKGPMMTRMNFEDQADLYFNEIFMNGYKELMKFNLEDYKEGYFYFDEPSIKVMGCNYKDVYLALSYRPYI